MASNSTQLYGFNQQGAARIVRAVKEVESVGAFDGAIRGVLTGGPQVIAAHLINRDSTDKGLYSWQQARRDGTNWTELTGGLSGTLTARVAIDITPGAPTDMTDQYVLLARGFRKPDPAADGIESCWFIVKGGDSLPRPRLKYQVLVCYNDTEDVAFDYPRFS